MLFWTAVEINNKIAQVVENLMKEVQLRYNWRNAIYGGTKLPGGRLKVGSCEEYAYEKYHRYSSFQDYSAQFGADYLDVFQIAFGIHPKLDGAGEAKLVGEDILDRVELNADYNNPITLEFNTNSTWTFANVLDSFIKKNHSISHRKNVFMSVPVREPVLCETSYDYIGQVSIEDDDLRDAINTARTTIDGVVHDDDWHCRMYEGLISDEEKKGFPSDPSSNLYDTHCNLSATPLDVDPVLSEKLTIYDVDLLHLSGHLKSNGKV